MIVKDINGYEGLYSINEDGGIWSYRKQKFLTPRPDKDGYLRVGLTKDKKQRTFFIHRLLAEAFIPNPDNLPLVNHKNEIKTDNRLENLEWATQWYNLEYSRNRERALRLGNAYETKRRQMQWEELIMEFQSQLDVLKQAKFLVVVKKRQNEWDQTHLILVKFAAARQKQQVAITLNSFRRRRL